MNIKYFVLTICILFSSVALAGGGGGIKTIKQISVNGSYPHDRILIDNAFDPDKLKGSDPFTQIISFLRGLVR